MKPSDFRKYEVYALVTGAASGMGRIYARNLALRGYNLLPVDIDSDKLDSTVSWIKGEVSAIRDWRAEYVPDFKIIPVVQDLSVMDAASRISEIASSSGCKVEVLVNNAGIFFFEEISRASSKALSVMMMVHNYTPLMLCREFVPGMIERGCGYVLNVSSLAAWMPWPAVGMYGDTKRFVKAFSRSLRIECAGTGVSVTTAYFGAVDTPLYNLKPSYRKLAHRLAVMISPEKAVRCALKAMFRRRKGVMPGLVNHLFKPLVVMMPDFMLVFLYNIVKKKRRKC